jgi:acyl-CoA synthetase (AMP-forming)/AMP-acid ligase II
VVATLLDLFDAVLDDASEIDAFVEPVDGGATRRITFGEWATAGDAGAQWLQASGVGKGDVVAITLPSGIDYAIAYQAIIRAGAIATGINPRLGPHERDHIVERAKPVVSIDAPLDTTGIDGDPLARRTSLDATDPLAIVWTGGTTGLPKGAWFDHVCLAAMAEGGAPISAPGDRRLSVLPFAHVGAMTRMWDELVNRITTVIVPSPWRAETAIALIGDEAVTVCQGVPTQYRMMFDHPLFDAVDTASLRVAGVGAARIPPELVLEMRDKLGCPVVVRYASTESCLATGTRLDDDLATITTTVGRPNGGVELTIVDDEGTPCPAGEVGTVCLRSRAQMRGYWHDPERTAEAIDSDGWLHTGDLGWVGNDGNLRLAGRRTEMYIRGGYNVYPIEVENCLGEHPDVHNTAVLGIAVEHRLGEIGVLFAVAQPGRSLELEQIRTFVKERLADYKAPDRLVVLDELPLTSIGKVDKVALRHHAEQEAREWLR